MVAGTGVDRGSAHPGGDIMLIATYLGAAEAAHGALTAWDQAAGDGDFGDNLCAGLRAAADRIPDGAGPAEELATAAEWFLDHVGGTSGPLFGLLFDAMARRVGAATGTAELDRALIDGLDDGTAAIRRVGEAEVGDRTMVDALVPAVRLLRADAVPDWPGAARTALQHARNTAAIAARMGRASYLGDRAIGTPDAGAMGVALLFWALAVTRVPGSARDLDGPDSLR